MGEPARTGPREPARLTAGMRSRKLQALDFIRRYYAEWGSSPSYSEIGAHLGVSKQRVQELVEKLSTDQQIRQVAGKTRGIELVERGEELSEAEVLLLAKKRGFTVFGPLTENRLSGLPHLDHD